MERFLGEAGLDRLRNNLGGRLLPKDVGERMVETFTDENYNTYTQTKRFLSDEMMKCPAYDGMPYKMADLYPGNYDVMGSVPDTAGFSSLPIADGIFAGCAGLTTLPDATFKKGVSAVDFARDCAYLENASWTVLPAQDLERAFYGCEKLEAPPEIDWPRVSNAYAAFCGCRSLPAVFPQVIDVSGMSEMNGWKNMFADSGVRLAYVKGYQNGSMFDGKGPLNLAWLEWNQGGGTESGDNTTVTINAPAGAWQVGSGYQATANAAGTYTVTAPTALLENYIDYMKENAARMLANEMGGGDRFFEVEDIDPETVSNPLTDGEKATVTAMSAEELAVAVAGGYPATVTKELKSENLGTDENPDWRYSTITPMAGNAHGNPWHKIDVSVSDTTYTYSITHYNDRTLKLAVRLV
ncbi:MAG: hypothetical protein IJS96_03365 [Schwartzia sp.]|nr:hypothetical protein [Schwartzia sp. (in: firmicutes)]